MSCNYADGLSSYEDKGVVGVPEKFDTSEKVDEKSKLLAKWILESQHVVVHTGAGISTSAGIPDFRGPNGVWTLEKKGLKPNINISFDEAVPTKTHMALARLVETGYVKYIVSQNIDGLHLRSGLPRQAISELHGNMFTENCSTCRRQFIRNNATTSVGQKPLGRSCPGSQTSRRGCRGKLHDTILDWEDNLPDDDLIMADYHSSIADLNICLGTTLQIVPSGNLPLLSKKYGGLLAIVNLQPTKHDKKANLIINAYVDMVIEKVMKSLGLEIPNYVEENDPTKSQNNVPLEWSFLKIQVNEMKTLYTVHTKKFKRIKLEKKLKKEEMDTNPAPSKESHDNVQNFDEVSKCESVEENPTKDLDKVICTQQF
ncbi:hypothetical protein ILUMI_04813 [Ignelater luminosus]|uniref:protein acetyllysine N-acetyltransferase n=1 Tax=Ignelater luminosus TaxID=2038154 RepID=A0A8K0D8Y4_IGNLU|nr:hypothetical protein ILUMI_04813 [Ignelater luminosus]